MYIENKIINFIKKFRSDMTDDDESILRYGIQIYYYNISKLALIAAIAILMNVFVQALIVFLILAVIKRYAYGFHADSFIMCIVITSVNIFGIMFLATLKFSIIAKLVIITISIVLFAKYVPADTEDRPLPNSNTRKILKTKGLIMCGVYSVLSFVFNHYWIGNVLILSMLFIGFNSCPILYKIFKKGYRNYEKFT